MSNLKDRPQSIEKSLTINNSVGGGGAGCAPNNTTGGKGLSRNDS